MRLADAETLLDADLASGVASGFSKDDVDTASVLLGFGAATGLLFSTMACFSGRASCDEIMAGSTGAPATVA